MRLESVVIYAAILLGASVGALKCFNCQNCAKYEGIQSVSCSSEATRCLKLHAQSGQISRECSTLDGCADSSSGNLNKEETKPELYTEVHCCEGDNCNTGVVSTGCLAAVGIALLINMLY